MSKSTSDRIQAVLDKLASDKTAFTAMPPDAGGPGGPPGGGPMPPGAPPGPGGGQPMPPGGAAPPPGGGAPPPGGAAPPGGAPPPPQEASEAEQVIPEIMQAVEELLQIVEQQGAKITEFEKQHDDLAKELARMNGNYETLKEILRNPDPLMMYQKTAPKGGGGSAPA